MIDPSSDNRCIVFVAMWVETFEIVIPVVEALRASGREVRIVVTPERDIPHRDSDGSYMLEGVQPVWDWLQARGLTPEPLVPPEEEGARIQGLRPQAVFLPTPYERQRHESLHPVNLGVPVHFINYGFNVCPNEWGFLFDTPFFRECGALYSENDYCTEQYARAGVDRANIVKSGHPALDHWDVEWPRADRPTVLWCPWWSTRWTKTHNGYSTFLPSYRTVLEEASRRPHMHFIIRAHQYLWHELRRENLWTEQEELWFHSRVAELDNVTFDGGVTAKKHFAFHPDHIRQFEQAWAMITDGISFLAEFGYTGKPLLLTQAQGNPGWNPVGQAIAEVVQRSEGIAGVASFLDSLERGIDPNASSRRDVIRRQFYRPPRGSAAAIAAHLNGHAF